jgi:uncharacterized protein YndB with AHSA1/START domain
MTNDKESLQMKASGKDTDQAITRQVEIEASPEAVWEALTTKEGLESWFPLEAAVEPGVGGSITLSWGPGVEGTAPIGTWEEGRRLVWIEGGSDDPAAVPVAVDFQIEGRSGKTVVRLVHSGFQATDDWGEFADHLDSGWRYFLFNLKHYLEHHAGQTRRMVWRRVPVTIDRDLFWQRLRSKDGLVRSNGPDVPPTSVELWTGEPARLVQVTPSIHLAAAVPDWNDGLLFVELEPGRERFHIGVWLSLYGVPEATRKALDQSLDTTLTRLVEGV